MSLLLIPNIEVIEKQPRMPGELQRQVPAKLMNALPPSAFEKEGITGWARPLLHVSYVALYKFSV